MDDAKTATSEYTVWLDSYLFSDSTCASVTINEPETKTMLSHYLSHERWSMIQNNYELRSFNPTKSRNRTDLRCRIFAKINEFIKDFVIKMTKRSVSLNFVKRWIYRTNINVLKYLNFASKFIVHALPKLNFQLSEI